METLNTCGTAVFLCRPMHLQCRHAAEHSTILRAAMRQHNPSTMYMHRHLRISTQCMMTFAKLTRSSKCARMEAQRKVCTEVRGRRRTANPAHPAVLQHARHQHAHC